MPDVAHSIPQSSSHETCATNYSLQYSVKVGGKMWEGVEVTKWRSGVWLGFLTGARQGHYWQETTWAKAGGEQRHGRDEKCWSTFHNCLLEYKVTGRSNKRWIWRNGRDTPESTFAYDTKSQSDNNSMLKLPNSLNNIESLEDVSTKILLLKMSEILLLKFSLWFCDLHFSILSIFNLFLCMV